MRYAERLERYVRWQDRWRDRMLTGLLVLLALEVFVVIPLARAHLADAPGFVVVWFLLIISAVLVTSTGYGDIVPVPPMARSLSNLEAVLGQLFPATLLARIVTLEMQSRGRSS